MRQISGARIAPRSLVILEVVEEAKNAQEEIDEVEVQADGSHNVFIWGKPTVDQVRVVDDVPAKQDRPSNRVQEVNCMREGDEYPDNSGHTECNETAEEPRPQARKVVLGLESEDSQAQEDPQGN